MVSKDEEEDDEARTLVSPDVKIVRTKNSEKPVEAHKKIV